MGGSGEPGITHQRPQTRNEWQDFYQLEEVRETAHAAAHRLPPSLVSEAAAPLSVYFGEVFVHEYLYYTFPVNMFRLMMK